MNIGFDLDKVFVDYPPIIPAIVFDRLYKKKSKDILLYRIPKKPEQIFRYLVHHPFLRPVMVTNLEVITSLKQDHKYFLISSRFGFLKKRTEALVKKNGLDNVFDKLFFNYQNKQPHEFKEETIRKLKIQKFIDDDLKLLEYLSKRNPNIMFYWLNNKKTDTIKENLLAITNIADAF